MVPTTQVRPGPVVAGAGWFDDPERPGQKRYWDGSRWTERRVPSPPVAPRPRATPAAGWYDDPTAPGTWRYWDGAAWAAARAPVAPPPPAPAPASPVVAAPEPATVPSSAPVAPPPPAPGPPADADDAAVTSRSYWDGAQWAEPQWLPLPDRVQAPADELVESVPAQARTPDSGAAARDGDETVLVPETGSEVEPEAEADGPAEVEVEPAAAAPEPVVAPPSPVDRVDDTESSSPDLAERAGPVPGPVGVTPSPSDPVDLVLEPIAEPAVPPAPEALAGRTTGPGVAWYRRRAVWAVAVVVLALVGFGVVRACSGPSGADPQPGVFEGSGDDGFTIGFTVDSSGDLDGLHFDVPGGAVAMQGTLDQSIEVDGGTFDVTLSDGLGLQTLTIEGRFTEGGTSATGSYDLELAPGVEQQSGDDVATSGSWQAQRTGD